MATSAYEKYLELDEQEVDILKALIWLYGDNLSEEEFIEQYEDEYDKIVRGYYYLYKDMSPTDYAREYLEECMDIPKWLENYIDYEKYGKDLVTDGNIDETPYGILTEV